MAEEIAKGVNTLKHLPPVALVGILVVGVGGVLYIRSRKGAESSSENEAEIPTYQPEQIVALERQLPGALPPSVNGGSLSTPPEAATPPRRDTPAQPEATNTAPLPVTTPTSQQGLKPITKQPFDPSQANKNPGTGVPAVNPTPSVPPQSSAPPAQVYNPVTEIREYPGYPNNFEPNRGMVQDTSGLRTWGELVQNEKNKNSGGGWNNTAQQRNLAQIAISGTARKGVQTKGSAYPPVSVTNTNRVWTNNVRVSAGLKPLTKQEWDQAQAFMQQLWNGDEKAAIFQSGDYARMVFEKYNTPYRFV